MTCTRSAHPSAYLLAALLIIPLASLAQQTNPVERLKAQYETHRQKIDAEALAAYSNVLVTVGNQLKQKADIAGYSILKSEQRFIAEKRVLPEGPDRTNLVGKLPGLDAPLSRIEANRNAKIANLLKQYILALEAQIRQDMTAEKLDEAKAAGDVKSSAELALADVESKLPKNELPSGKPAMPTQETPPKTLPPASKEYKIEANNPRGTIIGTFKKGDKIKVEYVNGKWTDGGGGEPVNPDKQDTQTTKGQIVLVRKDKLEAVAKVPIGTSGDPFAYECVEDGTYRIRISDNGCEDNAGSVRYKVTREKGQSKEESAQ